MNRKILDADTLARKELRKAISKNLEGVLLVLPRGRDHCLVVQKAVWRGKKRLDIRTYYSRADQEWAATKKGASLRMDEIRAFRKALRAAESGF